MPLPDGYGVLLGRFISFQAETPNNQGRFRHGHFKINVNGTTYDSAVDVDTQDGLVPVNWRLQELRVDEWQNIFSRTDGWYPLASNSSSGAVDYIRDQRVHDLICLPDYWFVDRTPKWWWPISKLAPTYDLASKITSPPAHIVAHTRQFAAARRTRRCVSLREVWKAGSSELALADMQSLTTNVDRLVFFGAPFRTGNGVHDVHQNQGDPPPPPPNRQKYFDDSGIWQDGISIAIRTNGSAVAFINKFGTQSSQTDSNGHPI